MDTCNVVSHIRTNPKNIFPSASQRQREEQQRMMSFKSCSQNVKAIFQKINIYFTTKYQSCWNANDSPMSGDVQRRLHCKLDGWMFAVPGFQQDYAPDSFASLKRKPNQFVVFLHPLASTPRRPPAFDIVCFCFVADNFRFCSSENF